jgi:hypothetical protein
VRRLITSQEFWIHCYESIKSNPGATALGGSVNGKKTQNSWWYWPKVFQRPGTTNWVRQVSIWSNTSNLYSKVWWWLPSFRDSK